MRLFFVLRYLFLEIADNLQDMDRVDESTREELEMRYFEALLEDEDFEFGLLYHYFIGFGNSDDNTLLFRNNGEDSATFTFTLTENETYDSYYSSDDVEIYFADSNDDWSDEYELEPGEDIELRFVAVSQISSEEFEVDYEESINTDVNIFPVYIVEAYKDGELYASESMLITSFFGPYY